MQKSDSSELTASIRLQNAVNDTRSRQDKADVFMSTRLIWLLLEFKLNYFSNYFCLVCWRWKGLRKDVEQMQENLNIFEPLKVYEIDW